MNTARKRKRLVIPLEEKIKALEKLDRGIPVKKVAAEYGVGEVTVGDWRRNRAKLEKWCNSKVSVSTGRKTMKTSDYNEVSEAVFLWFSEQREKGVPISGPILQAKALAIYEELKSENQSDFTASTGWLHRWKKRYGVRKLNVCGEKIPTDYAAVGSFQEKFNQIVKDQNLSTSQIYNCDETCLNYRMLPSSTLTSQKEHAASAFTKNKDTITILACSNASGLHKLRLICVGKHAKPRAFKNLNMNAVPVYYRSQTNCLMTYELFKEWFFTEFVPEVEMFISEHNLPRKALLLIENASHRHEDELTSGNIKATFLPQNLTSSCQLRSKVVLEKLKRIYKHDLLQSIIDNITLDDIAVATSLKNINLKEVFYKISGAWSDIQTSTIEKAWREILSHTSDTGKQTDEGEMADEDVTFENQNLLEMIHFIPGCEDVTNEEINDWVLEENKDNPLTDAKITGITAQDQYIDQNEVDESVESNDEDNLEESVANVEGCNALELALKYVEQQPEATSADVLLLKRWRDIAAGKRKVAVKQKKMADFFKSDNY